MSQKDIIEKKKNKKPNTEGERILAVHISDCGPVCNVCRAPNQKKADHWRVEDPKEVVLMVTENVEGRLHHWSLGKPALGS